MYAFHPAPGGYLSVVSADERSILIRLVLDVAALIADEDEAPPRPEPPMASDDLRRQADNFVDLADLADIIGRPSRLPRFIQESRAARDEHGQDVDAEY